MHRASAAAVVSLALFALAHPLVAQGYDPEARLRELGTQVWSEIERCSLPVTDSQRLALQAILAPVVARSRRTPESFLEWMQLPTENEKLEAAYGCTVGAFARRPLALDDHEIMVVAQRL